MQQVVLELALECLPGCAYHDALPVQHPVLEVSLLNLPVVHLLPPAPLEQAAFHVEFALPDLSVREALAYYLHQVAVLENPLHHHSVLQNCAAAVLPAVPEAAFDDVVLGYVDAPLDQLVVLPEALPHLPHVELHLAEAVQLALHKLTNTHALLRSDLSLTVQLAVLEEAFLLICWSLNVALAV